jgi:hypothetical protein
MGPLSTAAINMPTVPAPGDYHNGEIGGMIGRENRSTWRKPTPVPLCPPQTPHAARTRTRTVAVGSQRLTAWSMARTKSHLRLGPSIDLSCTFSCQKLYTYFPPECYTPVQFDFPWYNFLQPSVTLVQIFSSSLHTQTPCLFNSLDVRDQVPQSYKTTGRITVPYMAFSSLRF